MSNLKRRGLSGIFIFETFPGEERRKPTCFEDCSEEKQDEWLNSLNTEALKNLSKSLAKTLINVADQFGITTVSSEEEEDNG